MSSPYNVITVSEGFHVIEEGVNVGVRMYLFEGAERAMLVDTGFGSGDLLALCRTLTQKPIFVVHTHGDGDHVGCNGSFDEIYLHPADFAMYAAYKGSSRGLRPLYEGDIIDLGTRRFEVLYLPGHTPGNVAFLDRENRLLISGDPVQPASGVIYMFGQWRNMDAYICSLEKLIGLSDSFDVLYPSHSELTLTPDVVPQVLEAARLLLSGRVEGIDMGAEKKYRLFKCGGANFYYDKY